MSQPTTLAGNRDDDDMGMLVLSVFGSYKADITVKKPREQAGYLASNIVQ